LNSSPTGTEAFFNSAPDIENIFTRVTGGSVSNIDGALPAGGTAISIPFFNPVFQSRCRDSAGQKYSSPAAG
jgi:hypothetical protein